MSAPCPPRVIYVGGYSRCGSTLFDMILGQHADVASTGELTFLADEVRRPDRRCTCGETYAECGVYGPWLADRPEGEALLVRRIEKRSALDRLRSGRVAAEDAAAYRSYARSLFGHIAQSSGASVVVDSSKSAEAAAGRAIALRDIAELDVFFVHLTRDPRATLKSYHKNGSNWAAEGLRPPSRLDAVRPLFGWTLANRIASETRRAFGPERGIHVRYEDILSDPGASLERLGTFLRLDLSGVAEAIERGDAFSAGHNVGGNRTRLEPLVVKTGSPAVVSLSPVWSLGVQAIGGGLVRDLGYR